MNTMPNVRFARSENNRMLFGVAGGISERLGVDSLFVRFAFVLLTVDLGLGLALYFAAHALSVASDARETGDTAVRPVTDRHNLGFVLLLLASVFLARSIGWWIGDSIMWPVSFVAAGSLIILMRSDADCQRWETNRLASVFGSRPSRLRLAIGTVAVASGIAIFLAANHSLDGNEQTLLAVVATAAGMLLIFGPWLSRLGRQVIDERRVSVRTQERAEMGAHLHDSVLQTLAMIQRADSPDRMVQLARQQERDLRAWLHGRTNDEDATVKSSLEALAARIDTDFSVVVNVVVVGDTDLTDELRPLVAATQEAVTNAARHSGASTAHVYVEIGDDKATAVIRDEGAGFDLNAIGDDRQGVRESIRGRMQRHHGFAKIITTPGTGTEVELTLPLQRKDRS